MTAHARPTTDLYDEDFFVWTEVQADLLRARRFEALDLDNLIEEVEALGRAEKKEVLSNATVVVEHLLKLQHSPASDPRPGWIDSVLSHRMRLEYDLTPRLRQVLQDELPRVYAIARRLATPPAARARRGRRRERAARELPLHARPDHRRLVALRPTPAETPRRIALRAARSIAVVRCAQPRPARVSKMIRQARCGLTGR